MSAICRRRVSASLVPELASPSPPTLLLLLLLSAATHAAWQHNLPPRRYLRLDLDATTTFYGNHTDDGDFFRILQKGAGFIIVGARDAAYNLSLTDLRQIRKLSWSSNASTVELCSLKGKPTNQCQNYIRVMVERGDGVLMVCGTNAFSPQCRHYTLTEKEGYERESRLEEQRGIGLCPYSPIHNSTSTFVDDQLYVGTAADFSGQDALILRDRVRTDKWETLVLDDPHFVKSFALGEHVYFVFRENAIEYINCGKRVYSRVARVCRRDVGGPNRFKSAWTSYVKTRLNCSVGGDFPFYFDEIQATSDVVLSSYGGDRNRFIYGVFSTPPNGIGGSAVCAFRLQSVLDAFAGPFKERATLNSNWLAVPPAQLPEPRPGQCVNDSRQLPAQTLNFIKRHPLMDEAVGAFFGGPILTRISTSYRFSAVAVDPRLPTVDGEQRLVDVIFVGTDNGRVIKAFNADERTTVPVVIEEIQVFADGEAVRALHVSRAGPPQLVVSSDTRITLVALDRCYTDQITICSECVALQDPYCAWNQRRMRCVAVGSEPSSRSELVQNVATGVSPRCPQRPAAIARLQAGGRQRQADDFDDREQPLLFQSEAGRPRLDRPPPGYPARPVSHGAGRQEAVAAARFTAETLAVAVAVTAISALLLGFTAGHCCARHYRRDDANLPYADTDYTYFDQRQSAGTRLNHEPALAPEEVTYAEPVLIPTNNMVATLKKSQRDAAVIPIQYTDGSGPPLRLTGGRPQLADLDRDGPQLALRSHPYGTAPRPVASEEMAHLRDSAGRPEASPTDGYATTRSIRRVYL